MPSFWTHASFAEECREMLCTAGEAGLPTGDLARAILTHPHAFFTGMQGPDLFLFYPPAALGRKRLSSLLHTKKIPSLLCALFATADAIAVNPSRKDDHSIDGRLCALAYACGFLGHYLLDSHTHAFIYARAGVDGSIKSFARHNALECELSGLTVARRLQIPLSCLPRPRSYHLAPTEKRVLSLLLSRTIARVYALRLTPASIGRAFDAVHRVLGILYDPHGTKSALASLLERPLGAPYLSPLFLSERHYFPDPANLAHRPWRDPYTGRVSHRSFFQLYERALAKYLPLLCELEEASTASARKAIFRSLCRLDFHGEPIE